MTIALPDLKRQLEGFLLDLQYLSKALQQLRDLLPEHSEKRVTVLTLLGRLNDANKKSLRGTLDNTALQTEYNTIRADLSDLIQALEEADFDATAPAKTTSVKGAKNGNVLYRIPHTMPLGLETECIVRIALDEDAIVEEITLDNQVVLKNLSRVSDLMQVELSDPARESVFAIRSTSAPQQLITEEGYTQWFFYVEPLRVGIHPLEVRVSVLELALNQVHRKEIVFRETIEIVTEGPAAADDSEEAVPSPQASSTGFKNAGQAFAFDGYAEEIGTSQGIPSQETFAQEPMAMPPPPPAPSAKRNSGARTLALFMAFIMLGSTATWALAPAETRDWWVASIIQDDAKAYENYVKEYPDSPYLEKAVFFRAERSQRLADLRTYQEKFPDGKYQAKVLARVYALETNALDSVTHHPNPINIARFAATFPESERLPAVKQAAEARADNRPELLSAVEKAYVSVARAKPTATKITDYLRDFPQHDSLHVVAKVAASRPEVMAKVQPALEEAYLNQMEKNLTTANAEEFLEQFPEPVKQDRFDNMLDKKPAVKKAAAKKIKKMQEMRMLRDQR